MKKALFFSLFAVQFSVFAQSTLSVEHIMQDPKWMGNFPSEVNWDEKGNTIYFKYNPEENPADSLYKIKIDKIDKIQKVSIQEEKGFIPRNASENLSKTKKLFAKNDLIILFDVASGNRDTLLQFSDRVMNPEFMVDEEQIIFQSGLNLFQFDTKSGRTKRLTRINSGTKSEEKEDKKLNQQDSWLKEDNLGLLQVIQEREEKKEQSKNYREYIQEKTPFGYYLGRKQMVSLKASPDGKHAILVLRENANNKRTDVPDYTDASGYTVNLPARPKVGDEPAKMELAIYHIHKDTVIKVDISGLPGLKDLPDFVKDYPDKKWEAKERMLVFASPVFSPDGKNAIVNIRAVDNKDRWITLIDFDNNTLKVIDRQRDEAWIAGPGIGWGFGGAVLGWLPDNRHVYFQSEESGYSHLYLFDIQRNRKKALTSGNYEVFEPFISKDQKHWYLTTSEVHPGERHFYRMPLMGGKMEQLTSMKGNNEVKLSPDEKNLAIRHSYSNQPWELYLQANEPNAETVKLTNGQSEAFQAYPWRDPEMVKFKAEDGTMVPARLYRPDESKKNGAAVIFVHGAGYLQNVHYWWSSYFREYMFHNLLTDLGYTVLDIDYRASAGYGRDWRTGIYRHMGGKDLSDHVDGAKYLVDTHGVNPEKIGIYGGSYGGFITLMALFNHPETFKSGAALRAVTDWAHYNHGYTANILNQPFDDPDSYRRSSPIYFAEGLQGHLLIAHGMIDINVHFQDVVRLAQRLIELGKDNWEMAVYPVEDHGFVEPSSWTDEYKRILKLFNDTLLN